jgi:K+-transporting ATPase A subunit
MNNHAWLLLGLFMTVLLLLVRPLGIYISRVMMMERRETLSAASKKRCSGPAVSSAMKTWAG